MKMRFALVASPLLLWAAVAFSAPCCTWIPYRFIFSGDSISAGSDDERYPRDEGECSWAGGVCTGPPINRLQGYLAMADFGTCATSWPLMEEWDKELLEGKLPDVG